MNQNRNQNRRRGRGNNRGGPGGGHQQGNRIDSRARGNAPQMLEKYRKLAHDASLNGDRVLTEYYLQFADHYFRVVADSRTSRDDAPPQREHNRDQPFGDFENEDREQGGRDDNGREEFAREGQPRDRDRYESDRPATDEGRRGAESDEADEATAEDNPFTRDARPPRVERPVERPAERSGQRPRGRGRPANDAREGADEGTFDAAVLPPSIARVEPGNEPDEAPRPAKGRARRSRPVDDGDEEALEAVS